VAGVPRDARWRHAAAKAERVDDESALALPERVPDVRAAVDHGAYPISQTFSPAPALLLPIWSMSMVISSSSARLSSLITAGAEDVVEVVSPSSICSFADRMVAPFLWMSTMRSSPVGASR